MNTHDPVLLVGRIFGSAIFLTSGYAKFMFPVATKAYFVQSGIPLVEIAYWVAVFSELAGGIGLLLGFQTRAAAMILALYCIATALMVQANFADPAKLIHFKKNFAMAGGYLAFVAVGAGAYSIDRMLARRRLVHPV